MNTQTNLLQLAISTVMTVLMGGCLPMVVGCSQMQTADGQWDMEVVKDLAQIAKDSGATVELDVSLRPGSAALVEGVQWDSGIEITGRFRWQGDGPSVVGQ